MSSTTLAFHAKMTTLNRDLLAFVSDKVSSLPAADFSATFESYLKHVGELDRIYAEQPTTEQIQNSSSQISMFAAKPLKAIPNIIATDSVASKTSDAIAAPTNKRKRRPTSPLNYDKMKNGPESPVRSPAPTNEPPAPQPKSPLLKQPLPWLSQPAPLAQQQSPLFSFGQKLPSTTTTTTAATTSQPTPLFSLAQKLPSTPTMTTTTAMPTTTTAMPTTTTAMPTTTTAMPTMLKPSPAQQQPPLFSFGQKLPSTTTTTTATTAAPTFQPTPLFSFAQEPPSTATTTTTMFKSSPAQQQPPLFSFGQKPPSTTTAALPTTAAMTTTAAPTSQPTPLFSFAQKSPSTATTIARLEPSPAQQQPPPLFSFGQKPPSTTTTTTAASTSQPPPLFSFAQKSPSTATTTVRLEPSPAQQQPSALPPFTIAAPAKDDAEESEAPPVPDDVEQAEKDALFSFKCIVFSKDDQTNWEKMGVGFANIMPGEKKTLLVRAATTLGTIWINTHMDNLFKAFLRTTTGGSETQKLVVTARFPVVDEKTKKVNIKEYCFKGGKKEGLARLAELLNATTIK